MKKSEMNLIRGCILTMVVYIALVGVFYIIAGDQLRYKQEESNMVSPMSPAGELLAGDIVQQRLIPEGDEIMSVTLKIGTYGRNNQGSIAIRLKEEGKTLSEEIIDVSKLIDNSNYTVVFDDPIKQMKNTELYLQIESVDGSPGNAVTVWYGNSISTGRVEASQQISSKDKIIVNGMNLNGVLCLSVKSRTYLLTGDYYWHIMIILGVFLMLGLFLLVYQQQRGNPGLLLHMITAFTRYRFLLEQLVSRDFKTKYKRSALGVVWSFLNPLMMMAVQYIVFSTLFKSDIPNFAVYLLIGIVVFSFFSEACNMSMMSIVGNASLITKVYVPKYIFPVSRVISSTINLLLSLIPLLIVILVTRTPITPALFLLPFAIFCLVGFCIGMSFILASAMVFFRDTQFLWSVINMLWLYITPIFYPESIIPEGFMTIYKMNPLYQIIRFMRVVLMDGVSPEPIAYLFCLMAALIPLIIGGLVFKKTQDKFILNI